MSEIFFIADLHLGHAKIAEMRGFDSVASHDEAIVSAWCGVVRKRDVVHVLGDVYFGDHERAAGVLAHLTGTLQVVLGNRGTLSARG